MRTLSAVLLALALASSIAHAQRAPDQAPLPRHQLVEPAEQKQALHPRAEPDEEQLLSHRHYTTRDGRSVHSPSKTQGDMAPAGQCEVSGRHVQLQPELAGDVFTPWWSTKLVVSSQ